MCAELIIENQSVFIDLQGDDMGKFWGTPKNLPDSLKTKLSDLSLSPLSRQKIDFLRWFFLPPESQFFNV
ncbi:hypothetical protein JXA32_05915, partial [Candidatus Sumerlaeota bacterium]|nr:hypothetical protein [Candidatus Sumerlaeota bacterium]